MALPALLVGLIRKVVTNIATSFLGNLAGQAVSKKVYNTWIKVLASNFDKLFKKYPKAYSAINSSLKMYQGSKKFYKFFSNPQLMQRFLKLIPQKEIELIERNSLIIDFKRIAEKENVQTQKKVKDKEAISKETQQQLDELNDKSKWVNLSSSWILKGKWNVLHKNKILGTLLIQTKKSSKIYAYPLVPYEVWVFMKNATGENGGGAGTAFWRYWLHTWYSSRLRKKVLHDLKKGKLSYKEHIDIITDQVNRSAKSYFASKNSQYGNNLITQNIKGYHEFNLNKDWYKQRSKKGYLSYVKNSELKLIKQKHTKIIYGSKMVKTGNYNIITIEKFRQLKPKKQTTLTTYGTYKKFEKEAKSKINPIKRKIKKVLK